MRLNGQKLPNAYKAGERCFARIEMGTNCLLECSLLSICKSRFKIKITQLLFTDEQLLTTPVSDWGKTSASPIKMIQNIKWLISSGW